MAAIDWPAAETYVKADDFQNFEVDGFTLTDEARQKVREFAATYRLALSNPRTRLAIKGHASSTGSFAHNMTLSQKRAQFTHELLEAILGGALNVPDRNRLIRGYGKSEALERIGDNVENSYYRRVDLSVNGMTMLSLGSEQ